MKHYVYVAKYEEEIVYVGMGKGNRYNHLNSGRSSCYQANLHHFVGLSVSVEIVKQGMTEEDARELEWFLIAEADPPWNVMKPRTPQPTPWLEGNRKKAIATSIYLGVSYVKSNLKNPWRAWHRMPTHKEHIGYYSSEICAALARDKYVLDNGLIAILNF